MYANIKYINNISGEASVLMVSINGITSFVPIDVKNGDYNEIMRLVAAGELVIAPAS
jgi:hypothetical protein